MYYVIVGSTITRFVWTDVFLIDDKGIFGIFRYWVTSGSLAKNPPVLKPLSIIIMMKYHMFMLKICFAQGVNVGILIIYQKIILIIIFLSLWIRWNPFLYHPYFVIMDISALLNLHHFAFWQFSTFILSAVGLTTAENLAYFLVKKIFPKHCPTWPKLLIMGQRENMPLALCTL